MPESISHIKVGNEEHPIDASTIEGKNVSELQTQFSNDFQLKSNLVTSIDSNSTDLQYMSAKCLYDMVYGSGGEHQDEPLYDYSLQPLTFDIVTDGTILWRYSGSSSSVGRNISYKINDRDSHDITSTTSGVKINVHAGDKVLIWGSNTTYATKANAYNYFGGTATYNVSGNIMSLLGYHLEGDETYTFTSQQQYVFCSLFRESKVISCENLILPATTLSNYCYTFMFQGCTSLTTAPELPATTLVNNCYQSMFQGCTNLNYIKVLGTRTTTNQCGNWVSGVSSTGTFYHKQGVSWASGVSGCPNGWTKIPVEV